VVPKAGDITVQGDAGMIQAGDSSVSTIWWLDKKKNVPYTNRAKFSPKPTRYTLLIQMYIYFYFYYK